VCFFEPKKAMFLGFHQGGCLCQGKGDRLVLPSSRR
jgi:hypothetical protein